MRACRAVRERVVEVEAESWIDNHDIFHGLHDTLIARARGGKLLGLRGGRPVAVLGMSPVGAAFQKYHQKMRKLASGWTPRQLASSVDHDVTLDAAFVDLSPATARVEGHFWQLIAKLLVG